MTVCRQALLSPPACPWLPSAEGSPCSPARARMDPRQLRWELPGLLGPPCSPLQGPLLGECLLIGSWSWDIFTQQPSLLGYNVIKSALVQPPSASLNPRETRDLVTSTGLYFPAQPRAPSAGPAVRRVVISELVLVPDSLVVLRRVQTTPPTRAVSLRVLSPRTGSFDCPFPLPLAVSFLVGGERTVPAAHEPMALRRPP